MRVASRAWWRQAAAMPGWRSGRWVAAPTHIPAGGVLQQAGQPPGVDGLGSQRPSQYPRMISALACTYHARGLLHGIAIWETGLLTFSSLTAASHAIR